MSEVQHKYEFKVDMACNGCSNAVDNVITKLPGLQSHKVDLKSQTAVVIADDSLAYQTVYDTIAKTRKKIREGKADNVIIHSEEEA